MLGCACLFVSAMPGFRVVFAVILVSKKGPMCLHLFALMSVTIYFPLRLLLL